jgi:hypothetical protein
VNAKKLHAVCYYAPEIIADGKYLPASDICMPSFSCYWIDYSHVSNVLDSAAIVLWEMVVRVVNRSYSAPYCEIHDIAGKILLILMFF